jgi:hypothetical protein
MNVADAAANAAATTPLPLPPPSPLLQPLPRHCPSDTPADGWLLCHLSPLACCVVRRPNFVSPHRRAVRC